MHYRYLIPLLLLSVASYGQTSSLDSSLQAAIEQLFLADIPAEAPGGAIGIVSDGQIVFERYAGFADLDGQRVIDTFTRFNLASNAKQFTALCILDLIQRGHLKLSTDVRTYFPELYPAYDTPLQVKHLLTHSSGIRDVYALWGLQGITWWKEVLDNEAAMELLRKQKTLNFSPGSSYQYSNSNYLLLAELVGAVSGQTFADYAKVLFERFDLFHTDFYPDHQQEIPQLARPYFNFDTWQTYPWKTELHGDGALFSTLQDQLKWEQCLQRKAGGDRKLLQDLQQRIDTTFDYGYGLEFGRYRGLLVQWHNGSTGAWKASTIRFPEQQISIVAMNNSGKFGTSNLVRAVADVILGDKMTGPRYPVSPQRTFPPLPVDSLIGTYHNGDGFYFRFQQEEEGLSLHRYGRPAIQLRRGTSGAFREVTDTTFQLGFDFDAEGQLGVTAYHPTHPPYRLNRVFLPAQADYATLPGSYRNVETNSSFEIEQPVNDKFPVTFGTKSLSGEIFAPDLLVFARYKLRPKRASNGDIKGLLLTNSRLRSVYFERE